MHLKMLGPNAQENTFHNVMAPYFVEITATSNKCWNIDKQFQKYLLLKDEILVRDPSVNMDR